MKNVFLNKFIFISSLGLFFLVVFGIVRANDGSGTNSVSPDFVEVYSTGNTLNFTFTASETMDSGDIAITVPSGWSTPQSVNGVAGYTTASSASGIIANTINNLDSSSGWGVTNHMTLSADTGDKQEGTASLLNTITATAVANEQWYYNYGAASNWGSSADGNLRVGMWLKSSVNTASGNLSWQDDDTASLASPLDTIALPALTANTWAYTSATLGATSRTSILSYGFRYTTDIGATSVRADSLSVLFNANNSNTGWSGDANITDSLITGAGNFMEGTGAVRCTYAAGAGVGTSGDCFDNEGSVITVGPGTTVTFWVRSSVALNAGDFAWVDDNSSNLGSADSVVNLPAMSANTWTYVKVTSATSGDMRSFGLRQLVDKGAMTIDIDAIGKEIDTADSTTGWTAPTSVVQTISTDNSVFHEGTGSLKNIITASMASGDAWYENLGVAQDWSSYTTAGFWIRSTVAASAGDLQFAYDDNANLASPIATINIPALTANTWTYVKLTLTGIRTSVASYGIKYVTNIGATTINLDDVLVGPGSPTFPGGGIVNVKLLGLSNGQTVGVVYGSGGGVSGATAPSTAGNSTFTTQTRISDSGTLTNIASSPVVEVRNPVPTTTSISPTSKTVGDVQFIMTVNGTNFVSDSVVKFNGSSRATTYVSSTQVTATIPATDLTVATSSALITVTNPAPGGGISNAQTFTVNNPVPTTTSISPDTKYVGDPQFTMTVNGTNFVSDSVVNFNGASRSTTYISSTELSATIPASDLTVATSSSLITVTNSAPGGGTSNAQTFSVYNPTPTTTSISPTYKTVGDAEFSMTVNGTNFVSDSVVNFNGASRSTTYISSTELSATIPATDLLVATSSALITVTNPAPGGGTSNAQTFSVLNPTPTTTSISPTYKTVGDAEFSMTVNGTNFVSDSVVKFNGSSRATTYVSSTQVTATIPATDLTVATSSALITVTNPAPGGGTSNAQTFTINNPVPTTTSISPDTKYVGDSEFTMTVNGTNFVSDSTVKFNGSSRSTTYVSSAQLTATIPVTDLLVATSSALITVTNPAPGGGTSNAQTFTVNNPTPTTTSISPTSKSVGDAEFTMTVNGTNFVSGATVNFNGDARSTTYISSTELSATIPATDLTVATSSALITVTNPAPGGGISNAQTFTVNNPVPTTTSISPDTKYVGDPQFTMTVNGTNFVSDSVVNFNGASRSTTYISSTELSATIPATDLTVATSSALITVTNPAPGGGTSNAQTFSVYNPTPTTTSISPTYKTVGDAEFSMTVNGTNFVSDSVVNFNGASRLTVYVNSTQVTATILATDLLVATSSALITVTNPAPGGGISNAQIFAVNNVGPTTSSISPSSKIVGDAEFTMTVNGTNFVSGATVNFNGDARSTTYISSTELSATIPATDLTVATSSALITVTNPAPGGGTSNAQTFTVNNPTPTTTSISPTSKSVGDAEFTMTVNGTNFISDSVVNFNGATRVTTYVSSTQVTATIPATDLTIATSSALITVTNPAPGGGISNAQTFAVDGVLLGATKFNIIQPTNVNVGENTNITIEAQDNSGNLDTSYQNDVTLVTSGSATGGGLVDIINGVGIKVITDLIAETVNLSLSDTEATGLDVSSIKNIIFVALPSIVSPVTSVTPVRPTTVTFSGRAFPNAKIFIIDKDVPFEKFLSQDVVTEEDGKFSISFIGILQSQHSFGLVIQDMENRSTQSKFFNIDTISNSLVVKTIFVPPTIDLVNSFVTRGNNLGIFGYATPGSIVLVEVDNEIQKEAQVNKDGSYKLSVNTGPLEFGLHQVRAKQVDVITKEESDFSLIKTFTVSTVSLVKADLNRDNVIDVRDMSIFLDIWGKRGEQYVPEIDFNNDNKIDLSDFSVFIKTIRKK